MAPNASPTLYLRYEERFLPESWRHEVVTLGEILYRHNVRVITLLDRIRQMRAPADPVDHLDLSDAMLAIVGSHESTLLLAAAELPILDRKGTPRLVLRHPDKSGMEIHDERIVDSALELARRMREFVLETIGPDSPELREELETLADTDPMPPRRNEEALTA